MTAFVFATLIVILPTGGTIPVYYQSLCVVAPRLLHSSTAVACSNSFLCLQVYEPIDLLGLYGKNSFSSRCKINSNFDLIASK